MVTKHQILYRKDPNSGKIDLQERRDDGELHSIVTNHSVLGNPNKELTPLITGDEFDQALSLLTSKASSAGIEVPVTEDLKQAISIVKQYLPSKEDQNIKGANKINIAGYYSNTEVVISTCTQILYISNITDASANFKLVGL